jgi:chitin synthase
LKIENNISIERDKVYFKFNFNKYSVLLFTGYLLEANDSLSEAQKDIRARNTFLLALDGDVDFQPDAIVKLVKELIRLGKVE